MAVPRADVEEAALWRQANCSLARNLPVFVAPAVCLLTDNGAALNDSQSGTWNSALLHLRSDDVVDVVCENSL